MQLAKTTAQIKSLKTKLTNTQLFVTLLYRKGYATEILVNYEPSLNTSQNGGNNWLVNQKEKDQKGIYPTSANFSTDLHSLGQFTKKELVIMFETVVRVDKPRKNVIIPSLEEDL